MFVTGIQMKVSPIDVATINDVRLWCRPAPPSHAVLRGCRLLNIICFISRKICIRHFTCRLNICVVSSAEPLTKCEAELNAQTNDR